MYFKCITASVLALCIAGSVAAQETLPPPVPDKKFKKEEDIIIRRKGDRDEKTTIVMDGDKITVNGKDIDELHDSDLQVLRGPDGLAMAGPRIRMKEPWVTVPDHDFNFSFSSNRAFRGVMSEKNEKGARIIEVTKESPAAKAGLQKGDIITKVGDSKIEGPDDLYAAIGKYKPEEKVNISYLRDGNEKNTSTALGKNKENRVFNFRRDEIGPHFKSDMMPHIQFDGMPFMRPRLGLQVQDLDNSKGVKVMDVHEDAPAAKAGLQKGDIVTAIDGKEIKSVETLREKLRDLKEGDSVKLTYERNGKTQTAEVKFPKKLKTADL